MMNSVFSGTTGTGFKSLILVNWKDNSPLSYDWDIIKLKVGCCLVGYMVGSFVGRLFGWLVGRWIGQLIRWLVG